MAQKPSSDDEKFKTVVFKKGRQTGTTIRRNKNFTEELLS